jgi:DNA-binding CsgD family transcriptional regulator
MVFQGNHNGSTAHDGRDQPLKRIADAIASGGVMVLDADGEIVAANGAAVQRLNGNLSKLQDLAAHTAMTCTVSVLDLGDGAEDSRVCLVQETRPDSGRDLVSAVEAIMSDTSWLARAIIDKLGAWRQSRGSMPQTSDLEKLTVREREILALICEGCSDADMGRRLGLSQNTIRNHVASLYRKIGVNRRSAAVIWARERAVTSHDVLMLKPSRRSNTGREQDGH